jgi:hypothetical protein
LVKTRSLNTAFGFGVTVLSNCSSIASGTCGVGVMVGVSVIDGVWVIVGVSEMVGVRVMVGVIVMVGVWVSVPVGGKYL